MIKYLIEQGIINEFDLDKYCLECAIRVGFVDILKLLIDASTIHRNPTMLNPLLVDACLCGHFDIVVFLLQQGADVKAKKNIEDLLHSMQQLLLTIMESVNC